MSFTDQDYANAEAFCKRFASDPQECTEIVHEFMSNYEPNNNQRCNFKAAHAAFNGPVNSACAHYCDNDKSCMSVCRGNMACLMNKM